MVSTSNQKKTVLVLGASQDQVYLIRTIQSMGLRVLAVDMNPKSPGLKVSDDSAVISTRNVDKICAYLKLYQAKGYKVVGVITMGSDIPDVVAAISSFLGTPSISTQSAFLSVNKYEMKKAFQAKNIPIPWFKRIKSLEELKRVVSERDFPLILKPIDSAGSRGVFKLDKSCNLVNLFNRSLSFSRSGYCLVEEFLEGSQISTETVMFRGCGVTPGFADRNYEFMERFLPRIIENGGWVPTVLEPAQQEEVRKLVIRASLALGVTDGITKGDIVLTKEGPKVIEMATRLSGGDFSAGLVPLSTGVNYVEAAVKLAIGEEVDFKELKSKMLRHVANRYFFPKPGKLVRIEGVEKVCAQKWIKKLEFWYKTGDLVPEILSHAHRFGVFMVEGKTREEVEERIKWVYKMINVVTEPVY